MHLMLGATQFFVVGCYIPPSDLETLACINKAWHKCLKGAHLILVGNLNLNLRAPPTEREEMIAKEVKQKQSMQANRQGSEHQQQSINALIPRSVAPALKPNPSKAIWRPSTTSFGCLYSTGILLLHVRYRSTVLPSCPSQACNFAQCHSVVGSRAPGLIYAAILLCNILRISFAFQLRAPNPYRSASNVDCRCW
jgi:hypothetical protein